MADYVGDALGGPPDGDAVHPMDTKVKCVVVTPEATVVDETADFVVLPLYDGEIGIGPYHTPLIGRLGYGEMRIRNGNESRRWFVDGGFVEVAANVVSVLTSRAIPAEKIDPAVAEEELRAAQARTANSPELIAQRERAQNRARAQLRVASHAR